MSAETWAQDVVLAICTRNRADRLQACFEKALAQDCSANWGVLVVDSASSDHTPAVLAEWAARYPKRFRHVRVDKPGAGRARAAAVEHSTAPIVTFTDDDCYAEPDYLQQVMDIFASRTDLGMVGGRILLHDPMDYPITISESMERVEVRPRQIIRAGFIHGANMSFRREALLDVGGFDAHVGAGTAFCFEDLDITARVNTRWHVAYIPEPTVRHHHGRRAPDDVDSLRRIYDNGRGAFYMKMTLSGEWRYLKYWAYSMRHYPAKTSWRELRGGLHYLFTTLARQDVRPVRIGHREASISRASAVE